MTKPKAIGWTDKRLREEFPLMPWDTPLMVGKLSGDPLTDALHSGPADKYACRLCIAKYGLRGKAFQGSAFYTADNPPYGATFTYYLKDTLKTLRQKRQGADKKGGKIANATQDQLRAEAEEEPPAILVTISDADGQMVRTLTGPVAQGIHRVSWDLRVPSAVLPNAWTKRLPTPRTKSPAVRMLIVCPGMQCGLHRQVRLE